MSEAIHAVIMAGGAGTRFWPASRRLRPKQLLALAGDEALIRQAVERVMPLCGPERVWIATGAHLVEATLAMLPLITYRELREECNAGQQRGGAAASRDGAECADATAAESADGSSWGGSAHLDAWFFPDADSLAQECGICLERFKDDQFLRVLPCRHFFCAECIERWFETRGLNGQLATRGLPCPMCKADATEDLFANRPGLENQCVESR